MKVLVVTKIFPNALEPLSSPFNRQQFGELGKLCDVEVLATIPWFPLSGSFSKHVGSARLTSVPTEETIDGLRVRHPRFFYVPRVAPGLLGPLYAASLFPIVNAYKGKVNVLLGSWAYPDGFAAILLGQALGVPTVVKVHGSDINLVAEMRGPRRALQWALPKAAHVVAVSHALADKVSALGVPKNHISVVQNGVDTSVFRVQDQASARRKLGLAQEKRIALFVGRVEEAKGVLDLIDAFNVPEAKNANFELHLVGAGSALESAKARASTGPICFHGARPLPEVADWMSAADVVVLPSWNEGTPNVVLEAFACGRRVVATNVGGIPDVLTSPTLGELVPPRSPVALRNELFRALTASYSALDVHREGCPGSWAESARSLRRVLESAQSSPRRA